MTSVFSQNKTEYRYEKLDGSYFDTTDNILSERQVKRKKIFLESIITLNSEGKKDGIINSFYSDGNLKYSGLYFNGKKIGTHKEYFKNKNLKSIKNYSDNKLNGEYKEFYENGDIKLFGNYKMSTLYDYKYGTFYYYDKDGNVKEEYFDPSEKIKEDSIWDDNWFNELTNTDCNCFLGLYEKSHLTDNKWMLRYKQNNWTLNEGCNDEVLSSSEIFTYSGQKIMTKTVIECN